MFFLLVVFALGECAANDYKILLDASVDVITSSFTPKASTVNFIIALENDTKREEEALINDMISRCECVVFIEDVEVLHPRQRLYSVLLVDNFKSFLRLFQKISADTFVIDGFFLMIFVDGFIEELSEMAKLLWKIFIFNVNFLIATDDGKSVNLWTFLPFTSCESDTCHETCGDTSPIIINKFINGSFLSDDLYPEKISNLHRCPVKIVTFNAPPMMMINYPSKNTSIFRLAGVDGEMITLLSKTMNFTIDLFHISDNIR
jgi:hypothetical protein